MSRQLKAGIIHDPTGRAPGRAPDHRHRVRYRRLVVFPPTPVRVLMTVIYGPVTATKYTVREKICLNPGDTLMVSSFGIVLNSRYLESVKVRRGLSEDRASWVPAFYKEML